MSVISLAGKRGRLDNVRRALDLIADQIALGNRQRVLVKPNFVTTIRPLAATHVDAVRAVLGFLRDHGVSEITVAEGPSAETAQLGFERYGYLPLQREFGVRFVDLNDDDSVPIQIYNRDLKPIEIRLARTVCESDFRISVTPPKTHDTVIVTAGLKNLLMGSPLNPKASPHPRWRMNLLMGLMAAVPRPFRNFQTISTILPAGFISRVYPSDKIKVHQGYAVANLNLFAMAQVIRPHLTVLDAAVAMEGAGPTGGDPVSMDLAIASTDPIAADGMAAHLMGFDPHGIGYLEYCWRAGMGEIEVEHLERRGDDPADYRRRFRAPPTYQDQARWADPAIDEIVARLARAEAA